MANEATKPQGAQDDLRTQCPFCKGIGKRERTQFASAMDMDTNDTPSTYMAQCHECHGNGWVWALTQSEMAERIAAQSAELEQLRKEVERLSAPVSKREWADALTFAPSIYITDAERATQIIKDRLATEGVQSAK